MDHERLAWFHTVGRYYVTDGRRLLGIRDGENVGDPCEPWIVTGDDWLAVTDSEDKARTILDTIGGEIAPRLGHGRATRQLPPVPRLSGHVEACSRSIKCRV